MTVKPCLTCGKPTRHGSRCPDCQRIMDRRIEASRQRGTRQERGYTVEWYRIVKQAIREHPYCSVPGCTDMDLTGDHIIPRSKGGANERENCQVLCRHHNSQKAAGERRG